ncbi:MAG: ABC transporter permease [Planctomycetes bacterium]|nr:ABC transporter permease [Planctomycetota bacterium]
MNSLVNVATILRKELSSYFNSAIAYVFIFLFLIAASAYFFLFPPGFFEANRAEMRKLFEGLPYAFLVLVPAVSMRIWSEEKKLKTFQLLMTLPMRPGEIILGKFLAAWAVLCLAVLLTFPFPLAIEVLADLDWGPVAGGYLGAFLLVGAYLAVGLFVSGLFENQLISFVVTLVVLVVLALVFHPRFLIGAPALADLLVPLGVVGHFEGIARGVIDTQDLVYFVTVMLFFLGLNRYTIEAHKFG